MKAGSCPGAPSAVEFSSSSSSASDDASAEVGEIAVGGRTSWGK